jgi:hypothetical protein
MRSTELFPGESKGACVGTNEEYDWFDGSPTNVAILRPICDSCPVNTACYNYGIHKEIYGMYGGLTRSERKAVRVKLGIPEPQEIFLAADKKVYYDEARKNARPRWKEMEKV